MENQLGRAVLELWSVSMRKKRKSPRSGKEFYIQWQQKTAIPTSRMTYTKSGIIQKQKSLWKELSNSLRYSKSSWAILGLWLPKIWSHSHQQFHESQGMRKSTELANPSHLHLLQCSSGVIGRYNQKTTTNVYSHSSSSCSNYNSDKQWKSTSKNPKSEKEKWQRKMNHQRQ